MSRDAKALACRAALRYGCICVITGETDYVAELCDELIAMIIMKVVR